MQEIQTPFGPIKKEDLEAAEKAFIRKTPPQTFNAIEEYLASQKQAEQLKKFNDVVDAMLAKITMLINERNIAEAASKNLLQSLPDQMQKQLQQKAEMKWAAAKELVNILKDLKSALDAKNGDKIFLFLQKFTKFQMENEVPEELQKEITESLKPFAEEGLDESLIKLYLADVLKDALKQTGHNLPKLKEAIFEKLLNQTLTTPQNQTLFKEAAAKMHNFLKSAQGEQMVVTLLSGEIAAERDKAKNQAKGLIENARAKKSLGNLASKAEKMSDEDVKETSLKQEVAALQQMASLKAAIDPAFEQQLNSLQKIFDILSKAFPGDPKIQNMVAALNKIRADYQAGNVDYIDLANLEITPDLFNYINKLPDRNAKLDCMKQMMDMLNGLTGVMKSSDAVKQIMAAIQAYKSIITNANSFMSAIYDIINKLINSGGGIKNLSLADLNTLNSNYLNLLALYPNLTPDDQKAFDNITKTLQAITIKGKDGTANLLQIMIDNQVYSIIKQNSNPDGSMTADQFAAAKKQIDDMVNNFRNQAKTNPALQPYVKELANYVPFTTDTSGAFGAPFFEVDPDGTIYLFDPHSQIQGDVNFDKQLLINFVMSMAQARNQIQNTANNYADLITGNAINAVLAKIYIYTESLPDAFADVIINKFMPAQEARLWAMANLLSFYNMAASQDNQFLSKMSGWNLSNIDFACGKGGSLDCYTKELASVKDRLNQIMDPNSGVLKKLADTRTELDQALKDGKITQDQYNQRKTDLDNFQAKLAPTIGYLNTLAAQLEPAGRTPPVMPPNFDPATENFVKTNLRDCYSFIDADATDKTSLGQNQQMALQLTMTQMQQQWTIVTTCMTMLNQAYMTLARGIAPH